MTKTLTLKTLNSLGYLKYFMKNTLTFVFSSYLGNQRIEFTRCGTQNGVITTRLRSIRGTTSVLTSFLLAFCDQVIILY